MPQLVDLRRRRVPAGGRGGARGPDEAFARRARGRGASRGRRGRSTRTSGSTRCVTPRSPARSPALSAGPAAQSDSARGSTRSNREFERGLARCERREIVTSHAAFAYLAERYDLEQVPLVGVSPEAEPSAGELERLVDAGTRHGRDDRVLRAPGLAATRGDRRPRGGSRRRPCSNPLEGLTAEQEERGADYFDVMRENLAALRRALGCT